LNVKHAADILAQLPITDIPNTYTRGSA